MTMFDDRFGAAFPNRKVPFAPIPMPPGVMPTAAPPAPPAAVPPGFDPTTAIRTPSPDQTDAWRSGVDQDMSRGIAASPVSAPVASPAPAPMAPPVTPSDAFTRGSAPAVPYSRPAISEGPQGLTLNSAPAPGWAGTVDAAPPAAPDKPKPGFMDSLEKAIPGLEQIAKGLKPKSDESGMNTITPMSSSGIGNPNQQMGSNLLAEMLANRRRQYGMTLTG